MIIVIDIVNHGNSKNFECTRKKKVVFLHLILIPILPTGPKASVDSNRRGKNSYTHLLYSTTRRDDYLITLTVNVPEAVWEDYEPQLRSSINSFHQTDIGPNYVPPDKDPWRVW